jgi:plastocyanin
MKHRFSQIGYERGRCCEIGEICKIGGNWISANTLLAYGLLAIAIAGCGTSGRIALEERPGMQSECAAAVAQPTPGIAEVKIEQFAYLPRSLAIVAGTTVVWTNHDDAPHTVTEEGHAFDSKALDTDDKFEQRFDQPGTYQYFCALHPHMKGEIVVRDAMLSTNTKGN